MLTITTDHTADLTVDQLVCQVAGTADNVTHNDPQAARKEALHPTTKTAFISVQLKYRPRKTSIPYRKCHLKQMTNIQYSSITLAMIQTFPFIIGPNDRQENRTDYESDTTYFHIIPVLKSLTSQIKISLHQLSPFHDLGRK